MFFSRCSCVFLALLSIALAELSTSSRWIVDSSSKRVKLRCATWAGHMEIMFPEGLQHQTPQTLATWLSANGYNCVRLTYAIDMALQPHVFLNESLAVAQTSTGISESNMLSLWVNMTTVNPWLTSATRIDAFAKVIDTLWTAGVMTILDNHVSQASWCCSQDDGNGWWEEANNYVYQNSRFYNATQWLQGLEAMATFAQGRPGVVGMSVRNELRPTKDQDTNHEDWYSYVTQGAKAIYGANPKLLIIIGGINYATDLSFTYRQPLDTSGWPHKTVWEAHTYAWDFEASDCHSMQKQLGSQFGFVLKQETTNTGPLWISEFGIEQTGGPNSGLSDGDHAFLTCMVSYMDGNDVDWSVWALQGSYYILNGAVNVDESYGLLTTDWSAPRNPQFPALLGSMFQVTQNPNPSSSGDSNNGAGEHPIAIHRNRDAS